MATALLSGLGQDPFAAQCVDSSDLDSFIDFGSHLSPQTSNNASSSSSQSVGLHLQHQHQQQPQQSAPDLDDALLPLDQSEDLQQPAKPSHEYNLYKQQTGIPIKSVPGIEPPPADTKTFYAFGSGFDESSFMPDSSYDGLESMSALGISNDINMDMEFTPTNTLPAFFYPPSSEPTQSSAFVNPSALGERSKPQAHVRVWPGMHQQQAQQAAVAKAQEQSQHVNTLQQQRIAFQQSQPRPSLHIKKVSQSSVGSKRRTSSNVAPSDPQTEAVINRVVNQIVRNQNNALASGEDDGFLASGSGSGSMSSISRLRKDEEDMDEDERLLASEEGKKLSSKERRQLRNKVSARAFRSRRKEYISQLESEVASKVNEANELRSQNDALMEENVRSRAFIEKLLRHPAFHPFLEDLSRDPAITEPAVPAVPTSTIKDELSPNQSQQSSPQIGGQSDSMDGSSQRSSGRTVRMSGNPWPMPNMDMASFEPPQVFAVFDIPSVPSSVLEQGSLSGKDDAPLPISFDGSEKRDYPVIEVPPMELSDKIAPKFTDTSCDPEFSLYDSSPTFHIAKQRSKSSVHDSNMNEKSQILLFVHGINTDEMSMKRFAEMCARLDPVCSRIKALTANLDDFRL